MTIAFYVFAVLAVAGALAMVTRRNPLSGAFALVVSLVSVAGLFALLMAEFVFILQVLVYAGAIMVLVIFTIMLLNLRDDELREAPVSAFQTVALLGLCGAAAYGVVRILGYLPPAPETLSAGFGGIEGVGRLMLGAYLYPFEVISVLLLVAVAGVVLLAKKVI